MMTGGLLAPHFPAGLCGIVFDCDGVMIDSAAANRLVYNLIMRALGLPDLTREQEILAFQATFLDAIYTLVPKNLHAQIEPVCREKINYDRDILPEIKIMHGYIDFLEKARAAGLRLAIDTNRTGQGVLKVLDFLGLPNYFDPIISCTGNAPKPSPEGPELICTAWGAMPEQCLFVGDSPDDRAAAKVAGMVFAGFGGLAGDIEVASWEELSALLWPRQGSV